MAEKHEIVPTRLAKAFRETIRINSVSSLNKNILSLFHIKFQKDSLADLRELVDPRYFEPSLDDAVHKARILLSVGLIIYSDVMNASEAAVRTDFNVEQNVLTRQFQSNILKPLFYLVFIP